MRLVGLGALLLSGCCCNPFSGSESTREWDRVVSRERANRQTEALEAGTANVFVLEVSLPAGLTQAEQDALDDRRLRREVAALELQVSERKQAKGLVVRERWSTQEVGFPASQLSEHRLAPDAGVIHETIDGEPWVRATILRGPFEAEVAGLPREEVDAAWAPVLERQRATLAAIDAEPVAAPRPLEVAERIRFVTLYPPAPMIEEAGFSDDRCSACLQAAARHRAIYTRSLGFLPFQPRAVLRAQLEEGLPLTGSVSFGSVAEASSSSVDVPSSGRAVVRLEKSCPATLVEVRDTVTVGTGSGVIAVPVREERGWTELRDATCAGSGETQRVVVGRGAVVARSGQNPLSSRVMQLRAVLAAP
jgi:hypothetical protein